MNQMELESHSNRELTAGLSKRADDLHTAIWESVLRRPDRRSTDEWLREHKQMVRLADDRLLFGEVDEEHLKVMAAMLAAVRRGLMKAAQGGRWQDVWRIIGHIETTMKSKRFCSDCGIQDCNEHPEQG